jgi:hypothetical protein
MPKLEGPDLRSVGMVMELLVGKAVELDKCIVLCEMNGLGLVF